MLQDPRVVSAISYEARRSARVGLGSRSVQVMEVQPALKEQNSVGLLPNVAVEEVGSGPGKD